MGSVRPRALQHQLAGLVQVAGQVGRLRHRQRAGEVPADVRGGLAADGVQAGEGLVPAVEQAGVAARTVGDGQDAAREEAGSDHVEQGLGVVVFGPAGDEYLEKNVVEANNL